MMCHPTAPVTFGRRACLFCIVTIALLLRAGAVSAAGLGAVDDPMETDPDVAAPPKVTVTVAAPDV